MERGQTARSNSINKEGRRLFDSGDALDSGLGVLQGLFRRDRAGDGLGELDAKSILDLRPLGMTRTRRREIDRVHQSWEVTEFLLRGELGISEHRKADRRIAARGGNLDLFGDVATP